MYVYSCDDLISSLTVTQALPVASYLTRVTVSTPPEVSVVPLSINKQPFAVIGAANDPFLAKVLLEWVGGGKLEVDHWVDVSLLYTLARRTLADTLLSLA